VSFKLPQNLRILVASIKDWASNRPGSVQIIKAKGIDIIITCKIYDPVKTNFCYVIFPEKGLNSGELAALK